MHGFFAERVTAAARAPQGSRSERGAGHVPIETLGRMGCTACPRDKLFLHNPKMAPQGATGASVYFLGTMPAASDDKSGDLWSSPASRAVTNLLPRQWLDDNARFGNLLQCASGSGSVQDPGVHATACCRPRAVGDIERTRPAIVVGMGDDALDWATGLGRNTLAFRGTLIATRIGRHACWYLPIIFPNYVADRSGKRSEYELTMRHDIARLRELVDAGLPPPRIHDAAPYDRGIEIITGQEAGDMRRLEEALHWLTACGPHGLDFETSDLKPHASPEPKIWTAAAGTFDRTVAFSVDHPDGWGTETRIRKVRGMLGEYIAQSGRKRCHNLAFEQEWVAWLYGSAAIRSTEWEDTMALAHALDARKGVKSLDALCRVRFGFFLKDQSDVDVSRKGWIERHPLRSVLRYNGMDAKWTDLLFDAVMPDVRGAGLEAVYERWMRLIPTLVMTTAQGLPVDVDYARRLIAETESRIAAIEREGAALPEMKRYAARFGTFEWTNPDHVLRLFDAVCGRTEVVREYRGTVSKTTDEEALSSIPASELKSPQLVLDHRTLTRNLTTYLRPIVDGKFTGPDGLIHAEYSCLHTVTGRLNSPIHNWPKHKHKEVRGAVQPGRAEWFVAADYGQIEFRVAGMLSEDENIVKYSWTGYDVHLFWAERMIREYPAIKDRIVADYGLKDWEQPGPDGKPVGIKTLRQEAKNGWVFPQLFGSTSDSCAGRMSIPSEVAAVLGREFWDEFRGAKRWQERTIKFYEKHLYVETMGGFRRRGPTTINELINLPIQGTACEIVTEAQCELAELAHASGDANIHPAFNGHDDLSFIVADAALESTIATVAREMCAHRFAYINCPLIVEVSVGPRWDKVSEIAKFSSEKLFGLKNPYR